MLVYILGYLNITIFKNINIEKFKDLNYKSTIFHTKPSPPTSTVLTGENIYRNFIKNFITP